VVGSRRVSDRIDSGIESEGMAFKRCITTMAATMLTLVVANKAIRANRDRRGIIGFLSVNTV
jgi:hypothetical protein